MGSLQFEYRVIPGISDDDVGGDDVYFGESVEDAGEKIFAGNHQGATTAGDGGPATDPFFRGKDQFTFLFWNVRTRDGQPFDGFTADGLDVTITEAPAADLVATAWYLPVGGGDPRFPPPPSVRALAFDRTVNRFFRVTPIIEVSPGSAWAGGNAHSVATGDSEVTVFARPRIEIMNREKVAFHLSVNGLFEGWRVGRAPIVPDPLVLAAGAGGVAVAVYRQKQAFGVNQLIDPIMWKILHGIIDEEVIAVIRHPKGPSDGHGFGNPEPIPIDVDRVSKLFRRMDRGALEVVRAQAGISIDSARTVLEIASRVIDEGGGK